MKNIYEEISRFAKREKEETEKAVRTEESQVCIKADSYIAKEIKYQTALLHQILDRLNEIYLLKKKGNKEIFDETSRKKKNEVNVFAEERELLCKQVKLLAERSVNCHTDELAKLSEQMVAIYLALAYGKTNKAKKTTPMWEQSVSISLPDGVAERNPGDLVKKYRDDWKALTKRIFRESDV